MKTDKEWLAFYFEGWHGATQGEEILTLVKAVKAETFAKAAALALYADIWEGATWDWSHGDEQNVRSAVASTILAEAKKVEEGSG